MALINILFLLLAFAGFVYAEPLAIPAPPTINADAYLLRDFDSGRMLAAKNPGKKIPPASLTKMMSAYVAAHELEVGRLRLDDEVVVSEKAWRMPGSKMFIEVNKKVSVADLLRGVIIQSGNDASVALAEHVAGSEEVFANMMNQHAARLGMSNSHFTNSTGLPDANHYTTAEDLIILAEALIREAPEIYALHAVKEFTYANITQKNRNTLLWRDPSVDGIKTGHTEAAGYCLVASAKQDQMRLITAVIGSRSDSARFQASQALLGYGFRFYETQKLFPAKAAILPVKIWKGRAAALELGLSHDLYATFPRGQRDRLNTTYDLPEKYVAPVQNGEIQGTLKVMLADKEVASSPLIALQTIERGGIIVRLVDHIKLLFE